MTTRRASAARSAPGVVGIGIDLVETDRLRRTLERWKDRFLGRVFTAGERAYCGSRAAPWRHYAGRFAVKEAVSKAFGTGIGVHIDWLDIEVLRDDATGAPAVILHGRGARLAARRGVARVLVSLSHSRTHAVAQALLVGGARVAISKKSSSRPSSRALSATSSTTSSKSAPTKLATRNMTAVASNIQHPTSNIRNRTP